MLYTIAMRIRYQAEEWALRLLGHKHESLCGFFNCWDVHFHGEECMAALVESPEIY